MKLAYSLLFSFVFCQAHAHEGPTDGFGCHSSNKGGTYHCHTGPLAGRSFVTKAAAVNALMALEKATAEEEAAAAKPVTEIAGPDQQPPSPDAKPEAPAKVEALAKPAPPLQPIGTQGGGHAPASTGKAKPAVVPAAATKLAPPPAMRLSDHDPIKVISWSAPMLGKDNVDYRHIAQLIALADLVVFEDLSVTDLSRSGLDQLGEALGTAVGEKICRAIAQPAHGSKTRSGYLWKDRKIAFVRTNGNFRETCDLGVFKVTHRSATAQFYVRQAKQFINVTAIGKDSDLASVFAGFAYTHFPTIAAGDVGAGPLHANLKPARDQKFSPALTQPPGKLKSSQRGFQPNPDNIWYRGLAAQEGRVIDLHGDFPDLDVDMIRAKFSDHLPIYSEFRFAFDEEDPNAGKRQPTSEDTGPAPESEP
jgi:hypothetical protein